MVIPIEIGGGQQVTIDKPDRGQFDTGLRGAIAFTFSLGIYEILGWFSGSLLSFISGSLIELLDRIEPRLVGYSAPLIDRLLELDDIDPALRSFLQDLRDPTAAAGSVALAPFIQQMSGAAFGSLFGVIQAPAVHAANSVVRPTLPTLGDIITMERFGVIGESLASDTLGWLGYKDTYIESYRELLRNRPGPETLAQAYWGKVIDESTYYNRMEQFGFTQDEANVVYQANENLLDIGNILERYRRQVMSYGEAKEAIEKRGITPENADHILGNAEQFFSPADYVQMYRRGLISAQILTDRMVSMGFLGEDIQNWIEATTPIPGPGDLIRFAVREAYDEAIVAKYGYDEAYPSQFQEDMQRQGFAEEWARRYWRSHWVLPSPTAAYEMLHRGIIDENELDDLLRAADYPEFWRERLQAISYSPYTRVDVRRMHALGVLDDDGVKRAYMDIGFDEEKAETMLQFTKVYNQGTTVGAENQFRSEIEALAIRSYQLGHLEAGAAKAKLVEAGYSDTMANELLSLADWDRTLDIMPDVVDEANRDMKNIVTRAYALRLVDKGFATGVLTGMGVPQTHAEALLSAGDLAAAVETAEEVIRAVEDLYTSFSIDRSRATGILASFGITGQGQQELVDRWNVVRENRSRRIPRTTWRRLYDDGVIDLDGYAEGLREIGYAEKDIQLLTQWEILLRTPIE